MPTSTSTEGSDLASTRRTQNLAVATSGIVAAHTAGMNFNNTAGGSFGAGCAVSDNTDAQEIQLRAASNSNSIGTKAFQTWAPA